MSSADLKKSSAWSIRNDPRPRSNKDIPANKMSFLTFMLALLQPQCKKLEWMGVVALAPFCAVPGKTLEFGGYLLSFPSSEIFMGSLTPSFFLSFYTSTSRRKTRPLRATPHGGTRKRSKKTFHCNSSILRISKATHLALDRFFFAVFDSL